MENNEIRGRAGKTEMNQLRPKGTMPSQTQENVLELEILEAPPISITETDS